MNDKGAAMTRYEKLQALVQKWRDEIQPLEMSEVGSALQGGKQIQRNECADELEAAIALPENSKTVNAELYDLAMELADSAAQSRIESMCVLKDGRFKPIPIMWSKETMDRVSNALRYLSLREASGEPMPYKIIRDGGKVRFE